MGRAKNPNKKSTEQIVREALEKEQQEFVSKKSSNFEAPLKKSSDDRENFRVFWASARKEYKKTKDLEEILWAHLVASGHNTPDKFEAGLKHFGLKK